MRKDRAQGRKASAGGRRRPPGTAASGAPARQASARTKAQATRTAGSRKIEPAARRQAILDAALTVFAAHGFEAARLDDIAARAGVAKGTLYLYFKDKEALFEALIRNAVDPILARLQAVTAVPDVPLAQVLEVLSSIFQREVLGSDRKLLLRLIIAEGPRFPAIAEFHYRNVVARILPLVRKVAERAVKRGELANDALVRFPQLIAGPLLLAVIWDGMFAKIDPLDVAAFMRAYRELITARPKGNAS